MSLELLGWPLCMNYCRNSGRYAAVRWKLEICSNTKVKQLICGSAPVSSRIRKTVKDDHQLFTTETTLACAMQTRVRGVWAIQKTVCSGLSCPEIWRLGLHFRCCRLPGSVLQPLLPIHSGFPHSQWCWGGFLL